MMEIGVLSDTHSFIHPSVLEFLSSCHEIWHAGDIGSLKVIHQLKNICSVKAVYGNIDDTEIRASFPGTEVFRCENVKVVMMHIGGRPGKYTSEGRKYILAEKPSLFIAGHSHILKVMYDKKNELLFINPGAAGKFGSHQKITAVKFEVNDKKIENLKVIEVNR